MRISLLILFFILQFFALRAQNYLSFGFLNVAPGSGSVDPGPYPAVSGFSFTPFTAHGVSQQATANSRFSFSGFSVGAIDGVDDAAQFTGDFNALQYYEVCFYTLPGSRLLLTTLLLHMRRSSTGPRMFSVRWSKNNFADNLSASSGTNACIGVYPDNVFFWRFDSCATSYDQKGISLSFPDSILEENDTLRVRIYAWNAEVPGGSFSIDNVTITYSIALLNSTAEINSQIDQYRWKWDQTGYIQLEGVNYPLDWEVWNESGQKLINEQGVGVHCSSLPPGVYLVRARDGKRLFSQKICLR